MAAIPDIRNLLPALAALAGLLVSCGDRYDGPFTPGSPNYVGKEWAADGDGDGVADSLQKYQPGCRLPLSECIDRSKTLSRVYGEPLSFSAQDMILWKDGDRETPRLLFDPPELALRGYRLTSSDSDVVAPLDSQLAGLQAGSATVTAHVRGDTLAAAFRVTVVESGRRVQAVTGLDVELSAGRDTVPDLVWTPADASHRDYRLFSHNPEVAVIRNNRILGVKAGSSQITVESLDGGRRGDFVALVSPAAREVHVDSLRVSELYLVAGGSAESPSIQWFPDSASDRRYLLLTSDSLVAGVAKGMVLPGKAGKARLTAISLDGGKSAAFTVHVAATRVPLKGIRARPLVISVGSPPTAPELEFDPPDASNPGYALAGGNAKVAEILGGSLRPVAPGSATLQVIAADGGFTDSFTVTVTLPDSSVHVQSVKVADMTLAAGAKAAPSVTWTPSHAPNRTYDLSLQSGTSARAAGDSIEGLSVGTSVFRLVTRDSARAATFSVTVFRNVIPAREVIAEPVMSMILGEAERAPNLTFSPAGATETAYTLSVKDTGIATVVSGTLLRPRAVGSTEVTVRAGDSLTTTFTLRVVAEASPILPQNDLSSLSLSAGELDGPFSPQDTVYHLSVPNSILSTTVTVKFANPKTFVTMGTWLMYNNVASGSVALKGGGNTIAIVLITDGGLKKTYRVHVQRALGSNNRLERLSVPYGTLSPAFHPDTLAYGVAVVNEVSMVRVGTTAQAPAEASVAVNGSLVPPGGLSASLPVAVGETPIEIVVTAENGDERIYRLTVVRPKNANADLASLSLSAGTLSPLFSPATFRYALTLANAVDTTSVTAVLAAPATTLLALNGAPLLSGTKSAVLPVKTGTDSVVLVATAENGASRTYTVIISRAKSTNNYLAGLATSAGEISPPLSTYSTAYAVAAANGSDSVSFRAVPASPAASLTLNGNPLPPDTASLRLPLAFGSNVFTLVVTSESGTPRSYTLTVTRPKAGNPQLTALAFSHGIQVPSFSPAAATAAVIVRDTAQSIRLTPTALQPATSVITVNGTVTASGSESAPVSLIPGTNALILSVVSDSGNARTYAITVRRATGGIAKVSSGPEHVLILKTDGTLWAAGRNDACQLGDGSGINRPALVQILAGVADMAAGRVHNLILKTDGTLWASGTNSFGQLGDGTNSLRASPVQVMTGVAALAAGDNHSLFLKSNGTLWAAGSNTYGQLGDNSTTPRAVPVQVATGVAAVSAGAYHSLFLKTDGTAWAMGRNSSGQLGDGTQLQSAVPIQVLADVASLAAGGQHSLFVKTDGMLWASGLNASGQLGDGTSSQRAAALPVLSGVAKAAAGANQSYFLKTDGTCWASGANSYGALGDGTNTSRTSPVPILSGISQVSSGTYTSHFLASEGFLLGAGDNYYGQIGDGTTTAAKLPAPVSF